MTFTDELNFQRWPRTSKIPNTIALWWACAFPYTVVGSLYDKLWIICKHFGRPASCNIELKPSMVTNPWVSHG